MTCGIYLLKFNNTDSVYVGQSVNIENRFKQHIYSFKSNTAAPKLTQAYLTYGHPSLEIVLECTIPELDSAEDEAIGIFNSTVSGFNTYLSSTEAPSYTGYGYGNSKYSREEILLCVEKLLETPLLNYANISEACGVNVSTIGKLALTTTHQWVWEEYPEKLTCMKLLIPKRAAVTYATVSNKLSAKSRGIVYPPIKNPEGTVFNIDNAYQFAKVNNLAPNHFQEVLNGHRKSHKGWKLA